MNIVAMLHSEMLEPNCMLLANVPLEITKLDILKRILVVFMPPCNAHINASIHIKVSFPLANVIFFLENVYSGFTVHYVLPAVMYLVI